MCREGTVRAMKATGALAILVALGAGCGHPPARPRPPEFDQDAVPTTRARAHAATGDATVIDEGIVLPEERHAVGDRYTIVEEIGIKSRVELSADASIRYDRTQNREITFEVLEVDAQGQATRQRVTFAIDEISSILDRKAQRDTSVLAGKTYVVTHSADAVVVTDEHGRTPPKAEVAAVRAQAGESAVDEALERMFAGRRWYLGERVQLGAAALEAVNRAQRDPRTRWTSFAMELRAVEGGVATFGVVWSFDQQTNNGPLTVQLAGTKEIDVATGRMIHMTMRGPVRGHLGAPLAGEETMTVRTK